MKKLALILFCLSLAFLGGCTTSGSHGGSYEDEPQDGASMADSGCSS